MRVNTKSYPHPVLGNGDDLGGIFKVEFKYELGKEEVALNPAFSLKNTAIEELLKKRESIFCIRGRMPRYVFPNELFDAEAI